MLSRVGDAALWRIQRRRRTLTYDVVSTLRVHATDATGKGGGGKSARDEDLLCEGRG
jgi:hypothetical protein